LISFYSLVLKQLPKSISSQRCYTWKTNKLN
jgi:hypothetical protein